MRAPFIARLHHSRPNVGDAPLVAVGQVVINDTTPINVTTSTTVTATARVFDANNTELFGRAIVWSSSDPTKATIGASTGVITGVAAGTPVMTATCETKTDTTSVVVTTPINTVTQVALSNTSLGLTNGNTGVFTATPKDGSSNNVIGRTVTWTRLSGTSATISADSGTDPHTATITADASITGVSTFKATCDGVDSGTITITVSAVSAIFANEPAGAQFIKEQPFTSLVPTGFGSSGGSNYDLTTDATAPYTPTSVGRATYPTGFVGGSAPMNLWTTPQFNYHTLYICFWFKVSANWYGNTPSAVNKIFFIGGPDQTNQVYFSAQGAGNGALVGQVRCQNNGGAIAGVAHSGGWNAVANMNTASAALTRDTWSKWEVKLVMNTAGVGDGEIHHWMNGTKVAQYTDVGFSVAGQRAWWSDFKWNPTYGGGTATVPATQYQYVDHVYLSGLS